ncbi:uncharacterized protein PAN0_001d0288 [Moesziomyces antarcticus]|uniref:Uncharacterized protein n=1 Tax=Pseudozyma antarctica TaxID=84753 RepID=A0A5C3FGK0_PSEA2|nr:uncharacterized protein PAN0_001d0288 [Moesziomyces antarcticus]GAK62091.1 conserved hypothetical protein [Moesziomyces antarcticus]SPO42621.1 uncharacterized protein PSANT_00304 [Moesziomyces antarcticus]
MNRQPDSVLPGLGSPGSLKAVFGSSYARDSDLVDDFVDEILPDFMQTSISASIAASGRRSRLDESAGEGLRRNVLLRNAMLSSLERERRQTEVELRDPNVPTSLASKETSADDAVASTLMDEEAQFFEDLLSELTGSDSIVPFNSVLELPASHSDAPSLAPRETAVAIKEEDEEEEDFIELEAETEVQFASSPTSLTADRGSLSLDLPVRTLNDSCSSACSALAAGSDSGFAEQTSRPPSVASCYTGYPHVCPYPAISGCSAASSEELPALIDDDSDLEEDEDEVGERDSPALDVGVDADAAVVAAVEADASRSRPLSPILSPVHSVFLDCTSLRDQLSPESSRPTSPISSASSKGDGEGPSPLLIASELGALPSLAELSLQPHILGRPPRTLTSAWFETKAEATGSASTSAERMRWTSAPATHLRSPPTAPDLVPNRLGLAPHRNIAPFQPPHTDANDTSIVVHWSR